MNLKKKKKNWQLEKNKYYENIIAIEFAHFEG